MTKKDRAAAKKLYKEAKKLDKAGQTDDAQEKRLEGHDLYPNNKALRLIIGAYETKEDLKSADWICEGVVETEQPKKGVAFCKDKRAEYKPKLEALAAAEEAARLKAEAEHKAASETAAKAEAAKEAKRKAEEAARRKAEEQTEEAKKLKAEEAKWAAEAEAKKGAGLKIALHAVLWTSVAAALGSAAGAVFLEMEGTDASDKAKACVVNSKAGCSRATYDAHINDMNDAWETANLLWIGTGVAAVLAAGSGVTLYLVSQDDAEDEDDLAGAPSFGVTPGGVVVTGRF